MPVDLELTPKIKRPAGEPCCEPLVYPDVERDGAERLAAVARALGDPIRLQLVDVLRKHGETGREPRAQSTPVPLHALGMCAADGVGMQCLLPRKRFVRRCRQTLSAP